MLELIGIPKTKTKKKQNEFFRQKIVSSRRERKKKTERTNQKERIITEGKNERNDKKFT